MRNIQTTLAAASGVVAALAYLAAQEVDRRLVASRTDDLELLAGAFSANPRVWRPLGLAMHLTAGAVFGVVFDRIVAPRLIGPGWLRGLLFAQVENATLFPIVGFIDRFHPAIRRGTMLPLGSWRYFGQSIWRHVALGVVLGLLWRPTPPPSAP
jgi:hypothetical protein